MRLLIFQELHEFNYKYEVTINSPEYYGSIETMPISLFFSEKLYCTLRDNVTEPFQDIIFALLEEIINCQTPSFFMHDKIKINEFYN